MIDNFINGYHLSVVKFINEYHLSLNLSFINNYLTDSEIY